MAMNIRRNPLAALLDFATQRGDEATSIGSVMSQLAGPILKSQGVQVEDAVQRGPIPKPTLASVDPTTINDPLFGRMVQQESGGQSGLVSPKGAAGLSQVLPSTAVDPGYGVPTIFDMADAAGVPYADKSEASAKNLLLTNDALNLQFGQAYKNAMAGRYGGDPAKTAAAYNAGPGAVDQYGGVPPYPETQGYVANVVPGYNTSISTMGGPQTGGALPQTVEGILSSLYPDASGTEKAAHRKDVLMGLSQGLSALSQGRPVDLSNIAANADQRRRQNVVDMRERERSRAGAALIYSQTGDADMAGAVASGVMSINDVFSERERKRIAEQADAQRLKTEQANKSLGGLVLGMAGDLGFNSDQTKQIATALDNGVDPNSVLTLGQQAKVADAARKKEEETATAKEQRAAAISHFGQSQNPIEKTAASYMELNPDMSWADALKSAQEALKPATGAAPTADMQNAQALVDSGATNPNTGKTYTLAEASAALMVPAAADMTKGYEYQAQIADRMQNLGEDKATATRAVLDKATAAGVNLTIGPDGTINVSQGAGAPATGAAAPTTTTGVGGAFTGQFGPTPAGTVTTTNTQGEIVNAPIPGATAPQQALTDLAVTQADLTAKLQANREKAATETDTLALSALKVEEADLQNQQLAAQIAQLNADITVDTQTKQAGLAKLNADAMIAKKTYDDAVAASEQAKVDAQKQSSDSYINADKQFAVFEDSAKDVMTHGLDAMTTGLLGQVVDKVGGYVVDQTPRSDFLAKVGTMGSQLMMGALRDAKNAGVTLTPVTDTDLQVLGKSNSLLSDPKPLSGETIVKETAFQTNYMKDALYGPKDLTRYDEFGQPYKVGQSTLGVTEDTFARHWLNIPPATKEAWRTGKITALPTDDPNYAEAAKVINTLESNFKLYQPDAALDRSIVGIPAPEGISTEDWPAVWATFPADVKAELTKAAK